jgi:hypothetical protein
MSKRLCAVIAAGVIAGCATARGHVGSWAHEDAKGYTGLSLEAGGRCKFIGWEKGGAGVGSWCSYSRTGDTLEIHEFWDNSGMRHKPEKPVRSSYAPGRDAIVVTHDGITITLSRVASLVE